MGEETNTVVSGEENAVVDSNDVVQEEPIIVAPPARASKPKPATPITTPTNKVSSNQYPRTQVTAPVVEPVLEEEEEEPPASSNSGKSPADKPSQVKYSEYERKMRENKNLRDRLSAIQAEKEALEEAKTKSEEVELKESEKLRKQLSQIEADKKLREEELHEQRLARSIEAVARQMKFRDPNDVIAPIWGKIEYDDDGAPTNIADLLKGLAKRKPYLLDSVPTTKAVTTTEAPTVDAGNPANPGRNAVTANGLTKEALSKMSAKEINELWKAGVIQTVMKSGRLG